MTIRRKEADEKAAADKLAQEQADKAAAEQAAKDKAEQEAQAAKDKAEQEAADKLAAEQKAKDEAAQKAADEKAAADKLAAEQKAAEEQAAKDKADAEKAADDKLAAEQKAKDEAEAEQKAADEKAAADKLAAEQKAKEEAEQAAKDKAAEEQAAKDAAEAEANRVLTEQENDVAWNAIMGKYSQVNDDDSHYWNEMAAAKSQSDFDKIEAEMDAEIATIVYLTTDVQASQTAIANALNEKINAYRVESGQTTLSTGDATYDAATAVRAQELEQVWGHVRPDGTMCDTAYPEDVYENAVKAEIGKSNTVQEVADYLFSVWEASPEHNQNMLVYNTVLMSNGVYFGAADENGRFEVYAITAFAV